ncbi:adenylate cyclase [Bosea sp. BIWAKO-01]|uniref:adenylate cyclase n=1 Tax=Bosea sp. BIWAKO-01 TaxID=506668 RepID=UPI00086AB368|nr:adenylate cyclase [Bosea sp. BIWAKO-01]GAU85403.1 adenylate cyclase [Bosea sp. BIWAKO-01]
MEQLELILASPEFKVSDRIRRFLSYVTSETLAGRAERIKAYSIATQVLGRDSHFDIQNDPVVRIEAGRLRRAMERYYFVAGQADRVLIEIPKGGYVPHFSWRSLDPSVGHEQRPQHAAIAVSARPKPRTPWVWALIGAMALVVGGVGMSQVWRNDRAVDPVRPALVVAPFANLSAGSEAGLLAAGITEEVLVQLARFKEVSVYVRELPGKTTSALPAPEAGGRPGRAFVLEGSIRTADGKLRVSSRLLDGATAAILWSRAYDADLRVRDILGVQSDIAAKVATAVAQPYGIMFDTSQMKAEDGRPESFDAYQCMLRFYRYKQSLGQDEHIATRQCLEQTTALYPNYSTGWAMLSYLYLDEDRFQLNRRPGLPDAISRARSAAQRAVELDPENVRAQQALMTTLFFNQEPTEALRIGERALALNPNDMELLGEYGSRLAQAGQWKRGFDLLDEAVARNPVRSSYYVGMQALAAYMLNDDQMALSLIRRADLASFSLYHFVAALIYARAGLDAEATASRAQFLKLRPDFFANLDAELAKRNFNERDRAVLIEGARLAGFPLRQRLTHAD